MSKENLRKIKLIGGADVLADMNCESKCRACGKIIYWATTQSNRKMPIEITGSKGEFWQSHFTTCPSAKKFRKK